MARCAVAAGVAAAVFTVAVFGFLAVRGVLGAHAGCIGSVIYGTACPENASPFESLAFHAGALLTLSTALPGQALALAVFFAILFRLFTARGSPPSSPNAFLFPETVCAAHFLISAPCAVFAFLPFRRWLAVSARSAVGGF